MLYINNISSSQEKKDKIILDLHKIFLQKINTHLEKGNIKEIFDLYFDKANTLSEITDCYDWNSLETLRVSNINSNTNSFYTSLRSKLNLLSNKGKRHFKDLEIKGVENICKLLNLVYDGNLKLDNTVIYSMFEDLFDLYLLYQNKEEAEENIKGLIDLYVIETNIKHLSKMEKIDKNAEDNFYFGSLISLLLFKINIVTKYRRNRYKYNREYI